MSKVTKKDLLKFIDHKAFEVILKKDAVRMEGKQKEELKEVQLKTIK